MLKHFEQSDFIDCRINAYPLYVAYKGINRQAPDLIFVDFDRSTFKSDRAHAMALSATLKSCLLRIPGSHNSKYISSGRDPEVRVIQRLDSLNKILKHPK